MNILAPHQITSIHNTPENTDNQKVGGLIPVFQMSLGKILNHKIAPSYLQEWTKLYYKCFESSRPEKVDINTNLLPVTLGWMSTLQLVAWL